MEFFDSATWPLYILWIVFAVAVSIIIFAGTKLAYLADALADKTGVGEAIAGAVLLGGVTSIAGLITSVIAAYDGFPQLAVSNAVGGIAAQTVFLAIADFTCRKANLEHVSAELPNLLQCGLLITLLSIPMLAANLPEFSFFAINPATFALIAVYVYGIHLTKQTKENPMWKPRITEVTELDDEEDEMPETPMSTMWMKFALFGAMVAGAGWLVAHCGMGLVEQMGWSQGVVGSLLTAVSSSIPELITTLAAVRHKAYALALGGIIGGNSFDVLFVAASDIAYRDGSIYHQMGQDQLVWLTVSILMVAVLLVGLVRREKSGVANVGFESIGLIGLYLFAAITLFT